MTTNTKAKYLLQDVSFDHEDAHLAYTLGSGAASQMNEAYVLKGEMDLTEEELSILDDIMKAEGHDLIKAKVGSNPDDYAYVPDKETPSKWKLNIGDANHTRAAVAALGEGFRGQKVQIPEKDLAAVKSKVRAAYKKFFPNNEVPEVLKSLDSDSDNISESCLQKADSGDINGENTVTDKVELSKSEHEDLLKMQEELQAFKLEKAKELKKSKEDFVKGVSFIENTDEVVDAILKSSHGELIEDIISKAVASISENSKEELENLTKSLEDKEAELEKVKEELVEVKKNFAAPAGIEGDNNSVEEDTTKTKLKDFIKSKYKV